MAIKFLWDSCVCIDWIQDKDPEKRKLLRPIVDAATAGDVVIVVSGLVLAEVVQTKGKPIHAVTDDDDAKIRLFFLHPFVEMRPIDPKIGHLARDIMRARLALKYKDGKDNQAYKKLPVNDAIHIATALDCGCDCLRSFDEEDMLKENLKLQLSGHPKLKIELPSYTPPLPPGQESGQGSLFKQYGSLDKDVIEAASNQKAQAASGESMGKTIESEVLAKKAASQQQAGSVGEPPPSP
jgi:predicted nucleic acid-binding protein